jgi:hypothetical protein
MYSGISVSQVCFGKIYHRLCRVLYTQNHESRQQLVLSMYSLHLLTK